MTRLVFSILAAGSLSLFAQASSLQGTVADQLGATVPDAIISLANQETATSRRTLSSPTGSYSFPQLPPGTYRVEVQKPGFKSLVREVRLQINTPATVDFKMEVGRMRASAIRSRNCRFVNCRC
jgi:hypothetical protein